MSTTICLGANTITYPNGGGHLSAYLNWAFGFKSIGCRLIWMEGIHSAYSVENISSLVSSLKDKLHQHIPGIQVALYEVLGGELPHEKRADCLYIDDICGEVDLLLNQNYAFPEKILRKFKRTALLDIDPGLLQTWYTKGSLRLTPHDYYFTIGETVGMPGAKFSDGGLPWMYTPPAVDLNWWKVTEPAENPALTTITHWQMELFEPVEDGSWYQNDKRSGFLPYFDLPKHSSLPLELALLLGDDQDERDKLGELGWRIQNSHEVASTPDKYQKYIQSSLGEFSCVKPSCVRLQNAWISDRTICYLASGKPAIVEHTGPSRFLPDSNGLFRFNNFQEAIQCIRKVAEDYENQCKHARNLAEEFFDAKKITKSILERTLN